MFKAVFDADGKPKAFYNDGINADIPDDAIEISDNAWQYCQDNMGRVYWNGTHILLLPDPTPPEPVPYKAPDISDRQFIQALAEEPYKIITWTEALSWGARGELPKLLTDRLNQIEDDTIRNRAYMLLSSAKTYELEHPTTLQVAALLGWNKDALIQLWQFAYTL